MHISAFVPTSSVLVEGGVVNASGVPQTLELGDAEAKHRSKPCALHTELTKRTGVGQAVGERFHPGVSGTIDLMIWAPYTEPRRPGLGPSHRQRGTRCRTAVRLRDYSGPREG